MSHLYYTKLPGELRGSLTVRRRRQYRKQFALTARGVLRLRTTELDQLDKCKDNAARRLLLGVSK